MDLCPVHEGPLGAVCIQPPTTGQLAQALRHRSELRLALCFHSNADAHAPGRPKVSGRSRCSEINREHETLLFSIFFTPLFSVPVFRIVT